MVRIETPLGRKSRSKKNCCALISDLYNVINAFNVLRARGRHVIHNKRDTIPFKENFADLAQNSVQRIESISIGFY